MDLLPRIALVVGLISMSFVLNLPMGFLRGKTRKFSINWFLCIHAPIPFIFLGRFLSGLDFRYVPFFIAAAFLGQVWGGRMEL